MYTTVTSYASTLHVRSLMLNTHSTCLCSLACGFHFCSFARHPQGPPPSPCTDQLYFSFAQPISRNQGGDSNSIPSHPLRMWMCVPPTVCLISSVCVSVGVYQPVCACCVCVRECRLHFQRERTKRWAVVLGLILMQAYVLWLRLENNCCSEEKMAWDLSPSTAASNQAVHHVGLTTDNLRGETKAISGVCAQLTHKHTELTYT